MRGCRYGGGWEGRLLLFKIVAIVYIVAIGGGRWISDLICFCMSFIYKYIKCWNCNKKGVILYQ